MFILCQRFGHDYGPPKWTGESRKSPIRGISVKYISTCTRCGKEKAIWKTQADDRDTSKGGDSE